jgi:hypothetical protein
MVVRDTVTRIVFRSEGARDLYRIRRLQCVICGRIHRELPDFILPFKNYSSPTVQETLDSSSLPDNGCVADDSTMRRWRSSFELSKNVLQALLVSYYMSLTKSTMPLLRFENILSKIKAEQKHWLSFVLQLLINSGHRPHTGFAFCP